jgi:hypothetical protein
VLTVIFPRAFHRFCQVSLLPHKVDKHFDEVLAVFWVEWKSDFHRGVSLLVVPPHYFFVVLFTKPGYEAGKKAATADKPRDPTPPLIK